MKTPSPAAAQWETSVARASAFMDYMYAVKGTLGVDPIAALRESYAIGNISLGQFEAEVTVLLRRAA